MASKTILLSGIAGSGKDTFFSVAHQCFPELFQRFAFADELKKELAPKIMEDHGIDIFSCSREEKEKVRGELIAHGMKMREETGGKYWVDKIIPHLQSCEKIPVICDFRFPNERLLVAEKMETVSIYIETFNSKTGRIHAPTIDEEILHDGDIRRMAEVRVFWPVCNDNLNLLIPYVQDAIQKTKEILKF